MYAHDFSDLFFFSREVFRKLHIQKYFKTNTNISYNTYNDSNHFVCVCVHLLIHMIPPSLENTISSFYDRGNPPEDLSL